MPESTTFCLIHYSTDLTSRAVRIINKPVNLSTILTEYHNFADIFSKDKVKALVLYCLYNLQIKLEDREKLPIRIIYLLSTT